MPLAFRSGLVSSSPSAQAGKLSLPTCAEEVVQVGRLTERPSLSAHQAAEPQPVAGAVEPDLDNRVVPGQAT